MTREKNGPARIIKSFIESGGSLSILVSEDEMINQKYLESMLRKTGLACDCARDGRETLALIRRNRYPIVLLDMLMPLMSGEEVIAALKKEKLLEDIFIIALTAHSTKGDEDKYLSLGCSAFIAKPIDWDKLKLTISEAIVQLQQKIRAQGSRIKPAAR